jgi:hypothetical protein
MKSSDGSWIHGCAVVLVGLVVCGMCGGCGLGWLAGGVHYSDGFREGRLQKFSTKGIIWSTHEGELALPGMRTHGSGDDAQLSNTWEFSVRDPEIVKQITELHESDLVRLHYSQYLWSPPWKGSTGYFVTKVEKVKAQP